MNAALVKILDAIIGQSGVNQSAAKRVCDTAASFGRDADTSTFNPALGTVEIGAHHAGYRQYAHSSTYFRAGRSWQLVQISREDARGIGTCASLTASRRWCPAVDGVVGGVVTVSTSGERRHRTG